MKNFTPGVRSFVFLSRDNNPAGWDFGAEVKVADDVFRREYLYGFDGLERAFALLPQPDGGWKRFDLHYSGTYGTELGPTTDVHTMSIDSPFLSDAEADAIRRHGVAFGLDTNRGTAWLQSPDDNYFPS